MIDASRERRDDQTHRHSRPACQHKQAQERTIRPETRVERTDERGDAEEKSTLDSGEQKQQGGLGEHVGVKTNADRQLPKNDGALLDDFAT